MNHSFGGAFLMKIALIFLSIYIVILGFAMQYAKVFTMKNRLITLIEQYEGYDEGNAALMEEIRYQANRLNYKGATTGLVSDCQNSINNRYYCIQHVPAGNMSYYKVVTYIQFEIPIFDQIAAGVIPVTGETRYLYDFSS